jgi:hypothetical protein
MDLVIEAGVAREVGEALGKVLVLVCQVENGGEENVSLKDHQGEGGVIVEVLEVSEAGIDGHGMKMIPNEIVRC